MSGLKNSPFGKRLRGAADDSPKKTRGRFNPVFPVASASTPSLDSRPGTSEGATPESPERNVHKDYGDRFVPIRDAGDLRTTFHLMDDATPSTPSKSRIIPTESDAIKEQANSVFGSILHNEITPGSPQRPGSPVRPPTTATANPPTTPTRRRLFAYHSPSRSNPATPSRRLDVPTDEAYSLSPVRAETRHLLESPRRQLRSVCKTPYRVLDAPELADDFYLNLVDWSSTNVLGVGLGSCVYLWTAHTAQVSKLCDLGNLHDTISSVSWVQKGTTLAVGTLSGRLHIYDANTLQLTRTYERAHAQRIGALSWNSHILSSGSRDRMVHHRDVREAGMRPFKRCQGHRQEVCGLRWSGDGGAQAATLASGGNDNKVCIWDLRGSKRPGGLGGTQGRVGNVPGSSSGGDDGDTPLWKFHEHTAAVKALAWDPHVSGILATGGGTADKHIRFWNVQTGTMLSELDTGSQVCNLIWSLTSHEIVSTHGFSSTTAQNQICIWKYPTLDMVASLTGHTHRVLYLAMSPEGETIVTGAGDETLRFWNAFPKKENHQARQESRLDYGRLIR
ncbi:WD40 repeat-like protein [Dichomitus squalens LYAD-421 SS1]|uniref:WD40 repeat-like protein n=2 Tax=Dichomitus squalens TaxID=114155 RepID=A0A4Q9PPM8_9APHY|nr:WD40 repeat-like protein [Dichomitus squalens LYAD-421 SS1]EJF57183.1 WD40 repeat-like protein [Dichomitus squalens LYAD-421 SS1]TBU56290.1 WD40 repeat-like protein [Dichomitus squalens]